MASKQFEWSQAKWNPMNGCTKLTEGCDNCYAKYLAEGMLSRTGKTQATNRYPNGFAVTLHWDKLKPPFPWPKTKTKRVFVVGLGDLFHDDVPFGFIEKVWEVMIANPHQNFHILTKRAERALQFTTWLQGKSINPAHSHIRFGVTAENQKRADERIPILANIPAEFKFVSVEPMLSPVDLGPYLHFLNLVACGAEDSKLGARKMDLAWARALRDQCAARSVPFFFMKPSKGDVLPPDLEATRANIL